MLAQLTELEQRLDARAALAQLDPDELDRTFGVGGEPESESDVARLEVCPELYHGAADDAPLHTNGFVTEQCKVRSSKAPTLDSAVSLQLRKAVGWSCRDRSCGCWVELRSN